MHGQQHHQDHQGRAKGDQQRLQGCSRPKKRVKVQSGPQTSSRSSRRRSRRTPASPPPRWARKWGSWRLPSGSVSVMTSDNTSTPLLQTSKRPGIDREGPEQQADQGEEAAHQVEAPPSPSIWPPNSPDCSPCDHYLWGAVKRDTNRTACNTMAELKDQITVVFNKLPREQGKCACDRFRPRLEKVVEAEGAYFKKIGSQQPNKQYAF